MMTSLAEYRRALIWLALTIAFSLLISQAPLFNTLGFEFAFALSPFVSIASAHLAVGVFFRSSAESLSLQRLFLRIALEVLGALLLPSFLIGLLMTFFGPGCDLSDGVVFFLMGPVTSAFWGALLGAALALTVSTSRRAFGLFFLWILLRLSFNVYWFLAHPPIFSYNPIVGYFPGSLYDEQIEVEAPYLWFRLGNFLEAIGCLCVALWRTTKKQPAHRSAGGTDAHPSTPLHYQAAYSLGILPLVASICIAYFGAFFGFRLSETAIQERLGGAIETEHFFIYYPKGTDTAKMLDLVVRDHEYRYAKLFSLFQEAPEGKIYSYIYSDPEEKHKLFGTRNTQFAKPWLKQIHLNADEYPHDVLQHELIHVVSGSFADWPFRTAGWRSIAVNTALIEGLATGVDWRANDLDPHQWSAAMKKLGMVPPIDTLFSPVGFFGKSAGLSYTVSGSFVRFLIEVYGVEKMKVAYRTGDLETAYGKPVSALRQEWEKFLDELVLPSYALSVAKGRFDRPSIFSKICAHEQAARSAEAYQLIFKGEIEDGVGILRELCQLEPQNPSHLRSIALVYANNERLEEARATLLEALALPNIGNSTAGELFYALADIEFQKGSLEEARRLYSYVHSLHLSNSVDRTIEAKMSSLDDPLLWSGMRRYFFRSDNTPGDVLLELRELWEQVPSASLVPYLIGRQLVSRRDFARAVPYFEAALRLGLFGPSLQRECIRLLGLSRAVSKDYSGAFIAFYSLTAGDQPPETTIDALDWLDRLRWELTEGLALTKDVKPDFSSR
jgi:tetratricopeptide (TPR) repeat protein